MRLIDADALIESIKNTADLGGWIGAAVYHIKQVAIKYIDDAPSIDIEPKHGEWIFVESKISDRKLKKCSVCGLGYVSLKPDNYCPNCGAKMMNGEGGE